MSDPSVEFQKLAEFKLPPGFRGRSALIVQLWWLTQATLFRWSPQFAYSFRRSLLIFFGAKVGRGVLVRPTATITYPWKVVIGERSWIGDDVVIYSLGQIVIGENTVVSQKSYLCAADHDHRQRDFSIRARPIEIGSEVWVATDVFVGPGVSIGDGAVVGARSSVYTNLPSAMLCLGSPCRPVKARNAPGLPATGEKGRDA